MARKKALKAVDVDESSEHLLARIKAAVKSSTIVTPLREDYDPVVQLAMFAAQYDPNAEFPEDPSIIKLRLDAAKEVAKYLHPQKRSQEVVGKGGGPIEIKFADYVKGS